MAWLFLDTHENGRVRLAWFERGIVLKAVEKEGRASVLLPLIAKELPKKKLEGVCVVQGPGSFSAVRGGVLDANLLSRLLRVPLVPVSASEALDLATIAARLASAELAASEYVAPIYDAEPNITIPKA
ncbi:MAG TPA: hypothetical protein VMU11_02875 [Verrucomicrobiae bacterium]|nr:hypothetical protein [Verrucomicrobiae bacterium]